MVTGKGAAAAREAIPPAHRFAAVANREDDGVVCAHTAAFRLSGRDTPGANVSPHTDALDANGAEACLLCVPCCRPLTSYVTHSPNPPDRYVAILAVAAAACALDTATMAAAAASSLGRAATKTKPKSTSSASANKREKAAREEREKGMRPSHLWVYEKPWGGRAVEVKTYAEGWVVVVKADFSQRRHGGAASNAPGGIVKWPEADLLRIVPYSTLRMVRHDALEAEWEGASPEIRAEWEAVRASFGANFKANDVGIDGLVPAASPGQVLEKLGVKLRLRGAGSCTRGSSG